MSPGRTLQLSVNEDTGLWVLEDLGDPLGKYVPVGGTLRPPDLHTLSKEQVCLNDGTVGANHVQTPWECEEQASCLQGH